MKKILSIMLSVMMFSSFTGCGSKSHDETFTSHSTVSIAESSVEVSEPLLEVESSEVTIESAETPKETPGNLDKSGISNQQSTTPEQVLENLASMSNYALYTESEEGLSVRIFASDETLQMSCESISASSPTWALTYIEDTCYLYIENSETGEIISEKTKYSEKIMNVAEFALVDELLALENLPKYENTVWFDTIDGSEIITEYYDIYTIEVPGTRYYVDDVTGFSYAVDECASVEVNGHTYLYDDLQPTRHTVRVNQSTGEVNQLTVCTEGVDTVYSVRYNEDISTDYVDESAEEVSEEVLSMDFILGMLSMSMDAMSMDTSESDTIDTDIDLSESESSVSEFGAN